MPVPTYTLGFPVVESAPIVLISETPPIAPRPNMEWVDSATMRSFVWYVEPGDDSGQWVERFTVPTMPITPLVTVTTASHTLVESDAESYIRMIFEGPKSLVIPQDNDLFEPNIPTAFTVRNCATTGDVSIYGENLSVILNSDPDVLVIPPNSMALITRIGINSYEIN